VTRLIKDNKVFVETYYYELAYIHTLFVGTLSKTVLTKDEIAEMRRIHDGFYMTTLNIKKPGVRFYHAPTKCFTEFVKGITYFKNEASSESPIYHRYNSCGSKDSDTTEALKIVLSNSSYTKAQKQKYLWNCYVERCIYNEIYQRLFDQQDVRHMYQIIDIVTLLDTYLGYNSLVIKVEFDTHMHVIPITCIISFIEKGKTIREVYHKHNGHVHGKRFIDGKLVADKIQTFEQETPWIDIQ
jgi:hypothetical protein